MSESSTIRESSSSSAPAPGPREREVTALMIAWAGAEPHRIGDVALFEADRPTMILGRGEAADGAGAERVIFHRQRPDVLERPPPLASQGLSRDQLRLRLEG